MFDSPWQRHKACSSLQGLLASTCLVTFTCKGFNKEKSHCETLQLIMSKLLGHRGNVSTKLSTWPPVSIISALDFVQALPFLNLLRLPQLIRSELLTHLIASNCYCCLFTDSYVAVVCSCLFLRSGSVKLSFLLPQAQRREAPNSDGRRHCGQPGPGCGYDLKSKDLRRKHWTL